MRRALLLAAFLSSAAHAATFTVDTTSNGTLTGCTAAAADCSYKGAISRANGAAGADLIAFDIPPTDPVCTVATGVCKIQFATAGIAISDTITIDGYTQPGASANTLTPAEGGTNAQIKIELRGCGGCGDGVSLSASGTVRGLAIANFATGTGISLGTTASSGSVIEGNFIGTDASGLLALPNIDGVKSPGNVQIDNLRIGGALPAQRNLISGNSNNGISSFSIGMQVLGNLIGTNATGLAALPNQQIGLAIVGCAGASGANAQIGGLTMGERNVISGNGGNGIQIGSIGGCSVDVVGTLIRGNYLGAAADGVGVIGNGLSIPASDNVRLFSGGSAAAPSVIGGSEAGASNLIVGAGGSGVILPEGAFASVFGNRMRGNLRLGIECLPAAMPTMPVTRTISLAAAPPAGCRISR